MRTPTGLLRDALVSDPARPLLTWYGPQGARVELSVTTYDNWVAKTANLLVDELALAPAGRVSLDVPVHWLGLVWCSAVWAAGGVVLLGPSAGLPPDVAVVSPGGPVPAGGAADVVVLPADPLALRPAGARPPAVDYAAGIRAHGDRFVGGPDDRPDRAALEADGSVRTSGDLAGEAADAAAAGGVRAGDRLLVIGSLSAYETVRAALLTPLAVGAGAVVHPDSLPPGDVLDRLVAAEHVTTVLRLRT